MPFWKEPELPPVERLPKRPPKKGPGLGVRIVAAVAGVSCMLAAIMGMSKSLQTGSTSFGSFGTLALLLPAFMLLRYALTGQIKPP